MKKQTKNTQSTDIMINNICFFLERISGEKTLTFIDVVVVMVIFWIFTSYRTRPQFGQSQKF